MSSNPLIRYDNTAFSIQKAAWFIFKNKEVTLNEDNGQPVEQPAKLRIGFGEGATLCLSGQEAEDIWTVIKQMALNITRRKEENTQ